MLYGELIGTKTDLVGQIDKDVVLTQSKAVEPSTENIVVVPDSGYYLSQVSVKGVTSDIDPNIKADNIRLGASILGVEGNLAPDKPDQEKSVVPSKEQQEVVADKGYELAKVVVKATPLEELSVSEDGTYEPSGDNVGFSKVVVSVGGELSSVVEVPEELQGFSIGSSKQLFSFNVDDNTYLVSDSYSKTLWSVDKTTDEWTKLEAEYMSNMVYSTFCKIDDRVIITAGGGSGAYILYFDIPTKTIGNVLKSDGTILNDPIANFVEVGDKVIMGGNSTRISVYDRASKVVVNQLSLSGTFISVNSTITKVWNNKALINPKSTGVSSYVYIADTNEFAELTQPIEWGIQLYPLSQFENIVAVGGNTSNQYGLYVFDFDAMTFTKPSHSTVDTLYINRALVLDNKVIIAGKNNTNGVYVYDTTLNSFVAENTSSAIGDVQNLFEVDDYVLYSRSSSSGGLWQYDKINNTFEQIATNAYDYILWTKLNQNNTALIGREGYGFVYSFINGSFKSVYGAGTSTSYQNIEVTDGGAILDDSKTLKVRVEYNIETDTAKPIGVIL